MPYPMLLALWGIVFVTLGSSPAGAQVAASGLTPDALYVICLVQAPNPGDSATSNSTPSDQQAALSGLLAEPDVNAIKLVCGKILSEIQTLGSRARTEYQDTLRAGRTMQAERLQHFTDERLKVLRNHIAEFSTVISVEGRHVLRKFGDDLLIATDSTKLE